MSVPVPIFKTLLYNIYITAWRNYRWRSAFPTLRRKSTNGYADLSIGTILVCLLTVSKENTVKGYYFGTASIAQGCTSVAVCYLGLDGRRLALPILDGIFHDVSQIHLIRRSAGRRRKRLQLRTYFGNCHAQADTPAIYHVMVLCFDAGTNRFRDMTFTPDEMEMVSSEVTRLFIDCSL